MKKRVIVDISQTQAVYSSIGKDRDTSLDPFYQFEECFSSFEFQVTASFRKYSPQSIVVTPRDTSDTGLFFFASVEWAHPVVLETLRSTLLTSISLGMTNIRALWVELCKSIQRSYNLTITRSIIGRIQKDHIEYIANRLAFYKIKDGIEIELIGMDFPELGAVDFFNVFLLEDEWKRSNPNWSVPQRTNIEQNERILFLPDFLIFQHRTIHLPSKYHHLTENRCSFIINGDEVLKALLHCDASQLPEGYFDTHFEKNYDFSKCNRDNLEEYLLCFERLNKGVHRNRLMRTDRKNLRLSNCVTFTEHEIEFIKSIVNPNSISSIREKKRAHSNSLMEVAFKQALFPIDENEDLTILSIKRS